MTWDEMKALSERIPKDAALFQIGMAVVREWDPSQGFCPFCVSEEECEEGCPGPLIEDYIEKHGRPHFEIAGAEQSDPKEIA